MQKNKVRGTECYKVSPIYISFWGTYWSIQAQMTLDILIFLINMIYFVKARQYKIADYMEKHEIVNEIKSRITKAFIKRSKCAD